MQEVPGRDEPPECKAQALHSNCSYNASIVPFHEYQERHRTGSQVLRRLETVCGSKTKGIQIHVFQIRMQFISFLMDKKWPGDEGKNLKVQFVFRFGLKFSWSLALAVIFSPPFGFALLPNIFWIYFHTQRPLSTSWQTVPTLKCYNN